jgi:hypothetical protein
MSTLQINDAITEPSAVAPDARGNFPDAQRRMGFRARLILASGATALGSVLNVCLMAPSSTVRSALF